MKNYYSTRNKEEVADYRKAIFNGLAPDGGLYFPKDFPDLSKTINQFDSTTPFLELTQEMTKALLGDEFSKEECAEICASAFSFEPKLKQLEENNYVLELFHGPTAAFKDFGASFLAASMEAFLKQSKQKAHILAATSGDTGSAVANAFYNKEGIDVWILYPSGRVSPLQEKQLTTLQGNIHALEVKGSFDDCQRMVKEAFTDGTLKNEFTLTSANSISLGRLIPQSFYYLWAYAQLKKEGEKRGGGLTFTVPSGNFGNLTAGLFASKWGMKTNPFIAATNSNNIVPNYLKSGIYAPKPSLQTYSNAMDVGAPSNFERMLELYRSDVKQMGKEIQGTWVNDDETLEEMRYVYKKYQYLVCPHTAVGHYATRDAIRRDRKSLFITLATAHPAKFLEIVQKALGITPELPESLKQAASKKKYSTIIDNTLSALKSEMMKK